MNTWSKLVTALRGSVNEVGEAVIDIQALRILEQEIRDASTELQQSKDSLASIMARQKVSEVQCKKIGALLAEHEGFALQALAKGNEELASEVAQKIATLENHLANEQASRDRYAASAADLKLAIEHTARDLSQLEHEVHHVKATECVQKAQAVVAENYSTSHSKMMMASESLERIKEKQAFKAAQMQAAAELARDAGLDTYKRNTTYSSLEQKLRDAGISSASNDANAVLDRLKKTRS